MIVRDVGTKASVGGVTVTIPLPDAKLAAEPVIVAVPMPIPVTDGWTAGAVAPAAMETLAADNVTLDGSLLLRLIVTAVGAGADNVTFRVAVPPSGTGTLAMLMAI